MENDCENRGDAGPLEKYRFTLYCVRLGQYSSKKTNLAHLVLAVSKMPPIATDVACSMVCVSVCVLGIWVICAKTSEPIEMPFGGLTRVGTRNHVLDGESRLDESIWSREG